MMVSRLVTKFILHSPSQASCSPLRIGIRVILEVGLIGSFLLNGLVKTHDVKFGHRPLIWVGGGGVGIVDNREVN